MDNVTIEYSWEGVCCYHYGWIYLCFLAMFQSSVDQHFILQIYFDKHNRLSQCRWSFMAYNYRPCSGGISSLQLHKLCKSLEYTTVVIRDWTLYYCQGWNFVWFMFKIFIKLFNSVIHKEIDKFHANQNPVMSL